MKQYIVISVGLGVVYRWVVFFCFFDHGVCVSSRLQYSTYMVSADMCKSHIEMRKVFQYVCGTFVVLFNSVMRAESHFLKCFSHR